MTEMNDPHPGRSQRPERADAHHEPEEDPTRGPNNRVPSRDRRLARADERRELRIIDHSGRILTALRARPSALHKGAMNDEPEQIRAPSRGPLHRN